MEHFEVARLDRYFQQITEYFPATGPAPVSLVITHLLPDRPSLLRAIGRLSEIQAVLPKPRSVHLPTARAVERAHPVDALSRQRFGDAELTLSYLEERAAGRPVVLLDVGGYFARVLPEVCQRFSGHILGVVEDTENGHRRYLDLVKPPCPVYSVARSPLKQPEDHLVGQSIVFSTEALMRSRGDILIGRTATVIGFGKLGSSIAETLRAKGVRVSVFDLDPIRAAQAMARGFHVTRSREQALRTAGVVMCATGNLSLRHSDLASLANGAYLASVTSSDDEIELDGLDGWYTRTPVTDHITRFDTIGHSFYVLADGNAVNFLHGASVGAFIFLVQGEILAALARLTGGDLEPGYHEVPDEDRRLIASTWLTHFNAEGTRP